MKQLMLFVVLLASPLVAASADYSGESGYQQFKTCSSWLKTSRSYNKRTGEKSSEIDALAGRIDRMANDISDYKSDMSSAENWLSIQEAAGDDDGANRSVRKYNNARRNAINLDRKRDALIDRHNDLVSDLERIDEKHDDLIAKANRYCNSKTWTREIIDRACGTFNEATSDYCELFD